EEIQTKGAGCHTRTARTAQAFGSESPGLIDAPPTVLAPDPDGRAHMLVPLEAVRFSSPAEHLIPTAQRRGSKAKLEPASPQTIRGAEFAGTVRECRVPEARAC